MGWEHLDVVSDGGSSCLRQVAAAACRPSQRLCRSELEVFSRCLTTCLVGVGPGFWLQIRPAEQAHFPTMMVSDCVLVGSSGGGVQ